MIKVGHCGICGSDLHTAQDSADGCQSGNVFGSAERAMGDKADIVFECVGVPGLIAQAVEQVKPQGTILLLGLCTKPDPLNTFAMLAKEVSLVTSAFFTVPDYEASLAALDNGALEPRLDEHGLSRIGRGTCRL